MMPAATAKLLNHFALHLKKYAPELTDIDVETILAAAELKRVPRKAILAAQGEVFRYKLFVVKGLLKNFTITKDGNEHIMKFTAEGEWTVDSESYNIGTPAAYNIQAIEPSEVIVLAHDTFEELRAAIPALKSLSDAMLLKNISDTQKRLLTNISASAEDKYTDFIERHPHIHQRIPLHMAAAYIGVSRETLTRVRHAQLERERKITAEV